MIESIAEEAGTTEETVIAAILSSRGENSGSGGNDDLEHAEFKALKAPDKQHDPRDRFQKRKSPLSEYLEALPSGKESEQIEKVASFIDSIHMITRLRNVRALTGFSRILRNADNRVDVDLGKNLKWRPAIEYYGEGIFIDFNGPTVSNWADTAWCKTRSNQLIDRTLGLPEGFRKSLPGGSFFQPTPQFLFLHTFAHMMMLKLQFFAGYSSSAIKEKIFCSFPGMDYEMNGVLLLTSAGDVEGSMGGLARMGLPQNIMPLIVEAIIDARNCSYDPVCYESPGQGIDALNLAACHACTLVPETSCNYRNQFLDRAILLDQSGGLFQDIKEVI